MNTCLIAAKNVLALPLTALILFRALGCLPAAAQTVDSFNPGANSAVDLLSLQPDGKIFAAGYFTIFGGQSREGLVRLNADGTLDGAFNAGPQNAQLSSVVIQPDGKILAGGWFRVLGGQMRNYLGRLNPDGTADTRFTSAADYGVNSLLVQVDGKILVGGWFTNLAGGVRKSLGRLNPDGSLDSLFRPKAGSPVAALALQPDGKILVGRTYRSWGESPSYLERLNPDGSEDTAFKPEPHDAVYVLVIQPDGKILVAGNPTTLSGVRRTGMWRLNSDGSLDRTFDPGITGSVYSIAVQADGKILVAGAFATARSRFLARFQPNGAEDDLFSIRADDWITCIALQADGNILTGGAFNTLGGQARAHIGRLTNTSGAADVLNYSNSSATWFRSGTGPEVWHTTFEVGTNSVFTSLREGTRIEGGWQVSDVFLGPGGVVRARGYVAGGRYSSCGWLVESVSGIPVIGAPTFDSQPIGVTNGAGTTATFTVAVTGVAPLGYQWLKDGIPLLDGGGISGARSATLILANIQPGFGGHYQLVVTNAYGSATSRVAVLAVITPPVLTLPVLSQTAEAGSSVTFRVRANSPAPLGCLWYFGDTNQPVLAMNPVLTLGEVQSGNAGTYTVVVTNFAGATTASALLNVIPPVPRRTVPAVALYGKSGGLLKLNAATTLSVGSTWQPLETIVLDDYPKRYVDLSSPVQPQRFYRGQNVSVPASPTQLELDMATEITLSGTVGQKMRIDYINQFGPTDAWVILQTFTLTNTTQSQLDVSTWRAPSRLYRVVPVE